MNEIILNIMEENSINENCIEYGYLDDGEAMVNIYLNNKNLIDILKDKEEWIKCKNSQIEFNKEVDEEYEYIEKQFNYIMDNFDSIQEKISLIRFDDKIDIKKVLDENSRINPKALILDGYYDITDYEKIEDIHEMYKDYKTYIHLIGNDECVTSKQCIKTINYIKSIGDMASNLNLSPFETILFVYDIVRDRYYKEEKENEDYTESRDLTKVLFGNSIVCVGYANIFSAILSYLNIDNGRVGLKKKNDKVGHERNVAYIEDEKYNINGCYYFDPTWDSKVLGKENEFLLSYRFAAKTRDEMEKSENHNYTYEHSEEYSHNMIKEFEEKLKKGDNAGALKYFNTIEHICRLTKNRIKLNYVDVMLGNVDNIDDIKDDLENVMDEYNKPISAETFIKAISEVRKIEYYIDSEKYPYSINDLYCIFLNSEWNFKEHHYNTEERLLSALFGEKIDKENSEKDDFINFMRNDEKIKNEISGVKLTKVLRNELERRR